MQRIESAARLLALLGCLFLVSGAEAQEVSVRNKPYKGEMRGRGVDMLVRLDEIARSLEMAAVKTDTGWTLAETAVPTVDEEGATYIKLSDLTLVGCKVTLNKDFNIIDVSRPVAKTDGGEATWSKGSSGLTLVHFGAPW